MTTKAKLYKTADGRLLTKEEVEAELERAKDVPECHTAKALWEEVLKHPRKYRNVLVAANERKLKHD